ncbi:heterokaryon incompatibility protein-domain-containing protein [Xylaria cf. heliscus]|nr:heterokaryon incompatibility protein-domain-containing protein [Xylaria cf. heliscus]
MEFCSKCESLDLVSALRCAQIPSGSQGDEYDDGHSVLGEWHTFGRDVFTSALLCRLCALVSRGWRKWRLKIIRDSIDDNMFDPSNPPQDLYDDIEDMDIYLGGKTSFGFMRRGRYSSEGEKWNYVLAVTCSPIGGQSSFEVHDPLVTELRITDADDGSSAAELAEFELGTAVCNNPISVSTIGIAKDWLENCALNHEPCRMKVGTADMPTRFLDVNDKRNSSKVFLRESTDDADRRYVALSHCWGTSRPLCLTSTTLETLKQGISIQTLPNTFQDAVTVVRTLGVRYLWIDSLCIVQDDAEDWRKEAGRMAGVYRNAHLVLSASRAGSDEEGFLSTRLRRDHVTFTLQNRNIPLILKLLPPSPSGEVSGLDIHIVTDEPLSRRAWCLQERYLARRILHYGTQQMIWECGEHRAAEEGDFALVVEDQLGRIRRSATSLTTVFNSRKREVEGVTEVPDHRHTEWYAMIEDYTSRDITKDSDRLPALLGLRVALESQIDDIYLAGIWLKGLLEGLTWCAASSDKPLVRPDGPAIPSWTWASVKGPVRFPIYSWFDKRARWKVESTFEPLAKHLSHSDILNDDVSTPSQVRLLAPIIPVCGIKPRAETPPESGAILGSPPERSTVADRSFCFQRHDNARDLQEFWVDGAFDVREEEHDIDASHLHIIFLTRLPFIFEDFEFLEHRFGLLVVHQKETGTYRRVGYVDGCLLSGNIVTAFPREEGDMYAPEINGLAPEPLQIGSQEIVLI